MILESRLTDKEETKIYDQVIRRSKENFDFMIAICLIAKSDSTSGLSVTIKNHIKDWKEAGIIPHVPVSSGIIKKHVDDFILRYGEDTI